MTRPSTPPILSELRSPSSTATQVAALRALKNEIIGHEQKKEMWIGLGVVPPIARVLNTHKGSGKRRYREGNGGVRYPDRRATRTDEEEARLQAIIIVGSLAYGGPAYVSPLYAGLVLSPLLSILSPAESSSHVVLATLRALNTVADSLALERPSLESADDGLPNLLFVEQHVESLAQIIAQSSSSLVVQQQISLAAALISKTCREEEHRRALAKAGVLEALATRLASFVVATGCSLHATDAYLPHSGPPEGISPPATPRSRLAPVLEAVGTIIQDSRHRTIQFISAPAFAAVFPKADAEVPISTYEKKAPWASYVFTPFASRQAPVNALETLLPQLPSPHHRASTGTTVNFPQLGVVGTSTKSSRTTGAFSTAVELNPLETLHHIEDDENALVAWLLYIVRGEGGTTRLMAAWVLTILYRSGFTNRRRETGLAMLLVPLLVRMLDKDFKMAGESQNAYDSSVLRSSTWVIKEHAPAILAMLIVDSVELQRAAVDADAIKKLSQLLKESYDPLPKTASTSLWSPEPSGPEEMDIRESAHVSKLGPTGLSPIAYHVIKMREAVLLALAAIAPVKDEYRKAIIENGIVPFVIESLKPYQNSTSATIKEAKQPVASEKDKTGSTGNPTPVLLAAYAGIAAPLFLLLEHESMEVQVAATAVVCNLILEFSPMRETIIQAGILRILCEHAHSTHAKLRLNSVWALKHLVYTAPNTLKMKCLEELGPGWLKQIICNDTEDLALSAGIRGDRDTTYGAPITMGTPNAAGEQVDLLNAIQEDAADYNRGVFDDEEDDTNMVDSVGPLSGAPFDGRARPTFPSLDYGLTAPPDSTRPRVGGTSDVDFSASHQARSDDLAIQEQGLDLIRNLICGSGAAEMIDYMFKELGQGKLFDMLATKLRPRVLNARDRRSAENGAKQIAPPTEIVISVCYIIVHIAAGHPRHRQLLINQSELLKLLVPLFSHPHKEVRVCCAWVVINLTWVDDQSDNLHCKSRAHELRKLGISEKLEALKSDPETDVRERTKTAIHQMSALLR
ncbi:Armadillo-type fold [Lasallia pustulata]|uniref:Armadillo-type fold n=1 Tax=Lasallia pustulata TaxID=136370 RepID=A0A1W5CSN0_9LECA|nr:Armadillo-type fold [Lasallia pustulata]